ncbi:MAG: hypothetical protein ACXVGC_00255 [Mycobacteriaceae bacterium]
MSIWCSWESVGYDDSDPKTPRGGEVRSYASGWSNHYPTDDVELPTSVGLAHIAPWCVPGYEQGNEVEIEHLVGPWVRLDVLTHEYRNGKPVEPDPWCHSVVMDEAAARQLAADLLTWADTPKAQP